MIFTMQATFVGSFSGAAGTGPAFPQNVRISCQVETVEIAEAYAAEFPKGAKIRASRLTAPDRVNGGWRDYGLITGSIGFKADGVNGGINETGLKRYRTWIKALDKLDHTIVFPHVPDNYVNAYKSRAAFEEAIGA